MKKYLAIVVVSCLFAGVVLGIIIRLDPIIFDDGQEWVVVAEDVCGYQALRVGVSNCCTHLTITNGFVSNLETKVGNYEVSSSNVLTLSGGGCEVSSQWTVMVGCYGDANTLEILDGATLSCPDDWAYLAIGYLDTASRNCVRISGCGSKWSAAGDISVGEDGDNNSLLVENSGNVCCRNILLGENSGSENNSVIVKGFGSELCVEEDIEVRVGGNELSAVKCGTIVADHLIVSEGSSLIVSNAVLVWPNALSGSNFICMDGEMVCEGRNRLCLKCYYANQYKNKTIVLGTGMFNSSLVNSFDVIIMDSASDLYWPVDITQSVTGGVWSVDLGDSFVDYHEKLFEDWSLDYFGEPVGRVGDYDNDQSSNWDEFVSGSCPTNSASVFRIESILYDESEGFSFSWETLLYRNYTILESNSPSGGFTPVKFLGYPARSFKCDKQDKRFYKVKVSY